jgi:hypothetical protein
VIGEDSGSKRLKFMMTPENKQCDPISRESRAYETRYVRGTKR